MVTTTWKPYSTLSLWTDALEIKLMGDEFPSEVPCDLKITGNAVDCDEQKNLVVKAYNMLAADFKIPAFIRISSSVSRLRQEWVADLRMLPT